MKALVEKLISWIREQVHLAGCEGVVVGLSGGLDSSVTAVLCKKAFPDNSLGVIMPCHSNPRDTEDARLIAKKFDIDSRTVVLDEVFDLFLSKLPNTVDDSNSPRKEMTVANLKPRLRMITLYYFANCLNYLVVGTGNKSEISVGYFCYDEHTRAVTTEGLKTYKDLKPGDRVLSLDLNTGHVIECPVAGVYVFDYEGEMLAYGGGRGSKIDLMVTPNHRMLREWYGRPRFCRADEWPRRPTLTPTPRPWKGTQPPSVFEFDHEGIGANARRFAPMPMDEFLYILGLYIGDGHAQTSTVVQSVKGSGDTNRDPETGRFVTVDTPAIPRDYTGYRTWFALPEGSEARSKLIALLEKNGIAYGTTDMQVWVYGRPFYRAMEACGTSAQAKHIPSWVMNYPAEYLMRLMEGLMDSDGDGRGYYYTASQRLAEQVVELACKIGTNVTLRTRPAKTCVRTDGVEIKPSKSYELSIYGNGRRWLHGAKFKRVFYKGVVWCPDVPGTHNLLVERNGRFLFCGNTKYGDGGVDILPLGNLLKTQVRQLAKELGIPDEIIAKPPSAGLWREQTDEEELGVTYEELDQYLLTGKASREIKDKMDRLIEASIHKRQMPPVPSF